MVLPLFHNSFPVDPSSAYRTGADEFAAVKTMPFTTIGESVDGISRDVQPDCSASALPCSASFQVAIPPFEDATSQRVPAASSQLANSPYAAAAYPAPLSEAVSTICILPSRV